MKTILHQSLYIAVTFLLCIVAFFAGRVIQSEKDSDFNHAEYALKKTSLPEAYAPSYCLHGFTGFRDTFEQAVFEIPYMADREALMQCIRQTDGWTFAPATAQEFLAFASCFWYPTIVSVPDSVVFDAWFYRETDSPTPWAHAADGCFSTIGEVGNGFEFAVYDLETGLFIFVDQFG